MQGTSPSEATVTSMRCVSPVKGRMSQAFIEIASPFYFLPGPQMRV